MAPDETESRPWTARWCWTQKHLSKPWNRYALFRRAFALSGRPRQARVRVSASARYTLHVNGERIHQGPARSFPEHQSYDELEIAPFLRAGVNTLCAIVHEFGVPTFFSVYRDISGFILEGEIADEGGGTTALHTPGEWVCRNSEAWRQDVARWSVQMGFQEHFDADKMDADWMEGGYAAGADDWKPPYVHGPAETHPWLRMEARGVPPLADHVEHFKAVAGQFRGENARGHKVAADVYHLAQHEGRKKEKGAVEAPEAMLRDDEALSTVAPPPDGQFTMAVLDLGEYRSGHLMLDIEGAAGDEIIDIIYSEALDKGGAPMFLPLDGEPDVCEVASASRYRCRPGKQAWETFHYTGLRYAALVFRNVEKPLRIRRVALRQVHAAVEDAGAFECSDKGLNAIWRVGRETVRNCMFDALVDCPWREQAQWLGDVRVQSAAALHAFGETSLLRQAVRQGAQSQAGDGSLHAHPPADIPGHRLPDFMMTWVGAAWEHHQWTGGTDTLREIFPAMLRLLDFFERHETPDGLVGGFDGFWVFLDWAELRKEDLSAVLNLMHLQGLRWAQGICLGLGEMEQAARIELKAKRLAVAAVGAFWDPDEKVFRDGFDPKARKRVEGTSQHANALAILLDLVPEENAAMAREWLVKPAKARRGKTTTASPFFYAYVLEAVFKAGLQAEGIDIIRKKWGALVDAGATTFPEVWAPTFHSRCHGWSASPVQHLSRQVLGVSLVEAGWKRVRVAPFTAGLDFARGVVPTPLGPVKVEWEAVEADQLAVSVELPRGMTGEFAGPGGRTLALKSGMQEFHT